MSAPEQVEDLYRELTSHRVRAAIAELRGCPPECLPAHTAELLEQAAAALACATATYTTPRGPLARRLQEQITGMVAAAASFEQLADMERHNARRRH